jgi:lycopene cyclase domain-containing protein
MEIKNFTYLLLLLGLLVIPPAFGFKNQLRFFARLKYLLPSIIFSGAIFVLWDLRFTELGIWSFNPEYVTGVYIRNLPLEEWLSFLVIPYLCVFIYEYLNEKLARFEKPNFFLAVSLVLLVIFVLLAWFARQKLYTFFTFFLLSIYFGYTIFRNRFKQHLTKFYLTWLISLVPVLLVSGILTALPVVEYNEIHLLGIRFFSIPVENFFYHFLLLIMNITIYEYLKKQRFF